MFSIPRSRRKILFCLRTSLQYSQFYGWSNLPKSTKSRKLCIFYYYLIDIITSALSHHGEWSFQKDLQGSIHICFIFIAYLLILFFSFVFSLSYSLFLIIRQWMQIIPLELPKPNGLGGDQLVPCRNLRRIRFLANSNLFLLNSMKTSIILKPH